MLNKSALYRLWKNLLRVAVGIVLFCFMATSVYAGLFIFLFGQP